MICIKNHLDCFEESTDFRESKVLVTSSESTSNGLCLNANETHFFETKRLSVESVFTSITQIHVFTDLDQHVIFQVD